MTALADDLVPDELWALVEPLLPVPPRPPTAAVAVPSPTGPASPRSSTWPAPPPHGGCSRPGELGCGSPATCWRRPTEWANVGVFDQPHLEVWIGWVSRAGWAGRGPAWTP
jgi:hypothetical protein